MRKIFLLYGLLLLFIVSGCSTVSKMTKETFIDNFTSDLKANWTIENHTF